MPRILRIINRFNLGGPSYNAAYLTKYLAPEYETMLVGGSPLPDEAHSGFIMDRLGIEYHEVKSMNRAINPFSDSRAYRDLSQIIKKFRPDIVHTHAAKAGALGRFVAWRNKVPVVVHTFHGHVFGSYFNPAKTAILKQIERMLATRTSAIIAISPEQKNDLVVRHRICNSKKVHVIPLGLDLEKFSAQSDLKRISFRARYELDENVFAFGIIGRFAPVKNHALFFESIALLKNKSNIPFKAFIIGDGDSRNEYELLVKSKGLQHHVIFTSWIEDIDRALAGLDAVVLTSLNEGTPVSLIEAQAAGKPVISTDVGGVRDCMITGQTGLLVSSFKAEDISESMKTILMNGHASTFGEIGRKFVNEKFGYQRLVSDVSSLYHELLIR